MMRIDDKKQSCKALIENAVEELLLGSTTNMVIAEGSSDVLVCTARDAT